MIKKEIIIEKKYKIVSYRKKTDGWTKIYNSSFEYIESPTAFKVYCYLCYRYNEFHNYSFPSMNTIAKDCKMSKTTVQKAIKYLEEKKLIKRFKIREGNDYQNNCYRIRYAIQIEEEKTKDDLMNSMIDDDEDEIVSIETKVEIEQDYSQIDDDEEIED